MISDEDLLQFQGDENTAKILAVEVENEEDEPKVVAFPTKNFDKEFSVTDSSVIERIYAQFHQELFYSIRIGKIFENWHDPAIQNLDPKLQPLKYISSEVAGNNTID